MTRYSRAVLRKEMKCCKGTTPTECCKSTSPLECHNSTKPSMFKSFTNILKNCRNNCNGGYEKLSSDIDEKLSSEIDENINSPLYNRSNDVELELCPLKHQFQSNKNSIHNNH